MEDFAGFARNKLLGIQRQANGRAEQRTRRGLRMRDRRRTRRAAARARIAFRAATLLQQRLGLRNREDVRARMECATSFIKISGLESEPRKSGEPKLRSFADLNSVALWTNMNRMYRRENSDKQLAGRGSAIFGTPLCGGRAIFLPFSNRQTLRIELRLIHRKQTIATRSNRQIFGLPNFVNYHTRRS